MPVVEVEGLADLRKDLRALDVKLPLALTAANRKAGDVIAKAARASFESRPGVAPKVAPTVKLLANPSGASIRLGDAAHPYSLGSEFGAIRFKQFPEFRRPPETGYSLFPALREHAPEVEKLVLAEIDAIVRSHF